MGSDPIKEAANTMIVNTRLKRRGQRWGRAGGQEDVLTFRAWLISRRFDKVWAQRTHRRRYAHAHLSANDNRIPLRQGRLIHQMKTIRNQLWSKLRQRGITPRPTIQGWNSPQESIRMELTILMKSEPDGQIDG